MERRTLTCINCPMGCQVTINYELKDGKLNEENLEVSGNTCIRGKNYAISEVTNPVRMVTGVVGLKNRKNLVVSVKTSKPVPKDMVMEVSGEINKMRAEAPLNIGDVLVKDILKTGADIVVTRQVK